MSFDRRSMELLLLSYQNMALFFVSNLSRKTQKIYKNLKFEKKKIIMAGPFQSFWDNMYNFKEMQFLLVCNMLFTYN